MEEVSAVKITEKNWITAIKLDINPEQERWTPPTLVSLAKAYIRPGGMKYDPYGIIASEAMIGFYMVGYKPKQPKACYIGGFLIDKNHQRKGYGKAAIKHFLRQVRYAYPACEAIYLTVHPENRVARRLYEKVGFHSTGEMFEGEDCYLLSLAR